MVGIYTRISKDRPNQISTEVQKEEGIKLAKKLKLPYKLYEEAKGTSGGKSIGDRPKLDALVNDIEDGKITTIYFYSQDRSTRDELTWFTLANLLIEYKVALYENGIFTDLNDTDTFMLSGFKAVMAASERRKTGKKIRDALHKKAKDGIATNPVLTYGYKKDKNKYIVIDEEETAIVKRIFQLSLDGNGSEKIAMILNEEGIKTRYAKTAKGTLTTKNEVSGKITTKDKSTVKWSGRTILQILKNSWYHGERKYKGEILQVPAIISKDYQLKVIDNLQKNRLTTGKKTHNQLLKGILKCNCGCNMYLTMAAVKNMNFYKCSSKRVTKISCGYPSINRPKLDNLIWGNFFRDYKLMDLVKTHFKNTDEKELLKKLELQLENLNSQLKSSEQEITNAITFMTKGSISELEGEKQLKRIRTEKNDIDTQILNTENQINTYNNILNSSNNITGELYRNRNKASFNDQSILINKYIKSINVDFVAKHYHLKVEFNIPNINPEHLVVHRRFNYAVLPFKSGIIINEEKFNHIKYISKALATVNSFKNDLNI